MSMKKEQRSYGLIVLLTVVALFLFVVDLLTGSTDISFAGLLKWVSGRVEPDTGWYDAFILFRLPRVITAVLAGAALSVSGLLMQTLFRNPLAGPYILGISSGASLGVALVVLGAGSGALLTSNGGSLWMVVAGAVGAALIMILVSLISVRQKDIMTLLILGVLIGSVISAIVGLMQYLSQAGDLKLYVLWTMGSLRSVSPSDLNLL